MQYYQTTQNYRNNDEGTRANYNTTLQQYKGNQICNAEMYSNMKF